MAFEDLMDQMREAFDIHGETVKCRTCGMEMDELSVQHHVHGKCDCPSCDKEHDFPQCDSCYWREYYAAHDEDGRSHAEQWQEEMYEECRYAGGEGRHSERDPKRLNEVLSIIKDNDPEFFKQMRSECLANSWIFEEELNECG